MNHPIKLITLTFIPVFFLLPLFSISQTPSPDQIKGLKTQTVYPIHSDYSFTSLVGFNGIIIFMNTTCPICKNEILFFRELTDKILETNTEIFFIFQETESPKEVRSFMKQYGFPRNEPGLVTAIIDKGSTITNLFEAKITPQAFLFNDHFILSYSGRISDLYLEIGKKRPSPTSLYLSDALTKVRSGISPDPAQTIPIGCIIEAK